MSYIRSLGNPDKMYAWAGFDGRVCITVSDPQRVMYIPVHIFEGILLKWLDVWDCPVKHRGATLVSHDEDSTPDFDRLTLKYKGQEIKAWETTWECVAHRIREQHRKFKKRKKK